MCACVCVCKYVFLCVITSLFLMQEQNMNAVYNAEPMYTNKCKDQIHLCAECKYIKPKTYPYNVVLCISYLS